MATAFNDKFIRQKNQSHSQSKVTNQGNISAQSSRSRAALQFNQDKAHNLSHNDADGIHLFGLDEEPPAHPRNKSSGRSVERQKEEEDKQPREFNRKNSLIRKPPTSQSRSNQRELIRPPQQQMDGKDTSSSSRGAREHSIEYYTQTDQKHHDLHKSNDKFTNHEWPENKEYIDIKKLNEGR